MKNRKKKLAALEVKSFVTSMNKEGKNTVAGGVPNQPGTTVVTVTYTVVIYQCPHTKHKDCWASEYYTACQSGNIKGCFPPSEATEVDIRLP